MFPRSELFMIPGSTTCEEETYIVKRNGKCRAGEGAYSGPLQLFGCVLWCSDYPGHAGWASGVHYPGDEGSEGACPLWLISGTRKHNWRR